MSSRYYEAILQLRGHTSKALALVELMLSADKKASVSKVEKVGGGIDIYLSSQKFARKVGKALFKQFGGELKVNERLFSRSRQTSKLLYRIAVLFRPPEFSLGDVIKAGHAVFKVTGLGKKCTGLNLKTGKREEIACEGVKVLEMQDTTVSKSYPVLEVIHPHTFQSMPVNNPKKLLPGKKVKVAVDEGVWIV